MIFQYLTSDQEVASKEKKRYLRSYRTLTPYETVLIHVWTSSSIQSPPTHASVRSSASICTSTCVRRLWHYIDILKLPMLSMQVGGLFLSSKVNIDSLIECSHIKYHNKLQSKFNNKFCSKFIAIRQHNWQHILHSIL